MLTNNTEHDIIKFLEFTSLYGTDGLDRTLVRGDTMDWIKPLTDWTYRIQFRRRGLSRYIVR